jgi:hypothetical protein
MDTGLESLEWDAAVLGEHYSIFLSLLSGGQIKAFPSIQLLPLQQVLLVNAFSSRGDRRGSLPFLPPVNSLVHNAALLRSTRQQTQLPLQESGENFTWFPLNNFHLRSLSAAFNENVSILLHRTGATSLLTDPQRTIINSLIFHPLQNARDHGVATDPHRFSGISTRVTEQIAPLAPGIKEYLDHLSAASPRHRLFLEIVIHDDGSGISNHFYRSKTKPEAPGLYTRPIEAEWTFLNQAFERHATSKYFATITSALEAPGIGLAALMGSLKRLNAFMELRTGRLRVYRWFQNDELIPRQAMLLPPSPSNPLPAVPGTVFRFFVPLFGR